MKLIKGLLPLPVLILLLNCSEQTAGSPDSDSVPVDADYNALRVNRANAPVDSDFPHRADFIYPTNPNSATDVVVLIHGGGGEKHQFANALGFKDENTTDYNFDQPNYRQEYLDEHNLAFIFVQGLNIDSQPGAYTWNNTIMTSGLDDKELLKRLSSYLRLTEGFNSVFLMGHSMGGTMTNRMWCEASSYFDGFGSSAGPMSPTLFNSCAPETFKPYIHVTGLNDRIIQLVEERFTGATINHHDAEFLELDSLTRLAGGEAFVHPTPEFQNELTSYPTRVDWVCGETTNPPQQIPSPFDWHTEVYNQCNGKIKMMLLKDKDHCTGGEGGTYKCDKPLTTLGTTDHLDRFIDFFNENR